MFRHKLKMTPLNYMTLLFSFNLLIKLKGRDTRKKNNKSKCILKTKVNKSQNEMVQVFLKLDPALDKNLINMSLQNNSFAALFCK